MRKLRMFQDIGASGVSRLEDEVNDWLATVGEAVEIVDQTINTTTVCEDGNEHYQHIIVSVWYEEDVD